MGKKSYDSASAFGPHAKKPEPPKADPLTKENIAKALSHPVDCPCKFCTYMESAAVKFLGGIGKPFQAIGDAAKNVANAFVKSMIADDPNPGCGDAGCEFCEPLVYAAKQQKLAEKKQLLGKAYGLQPDEVAAKMTPGEASISFAMEKKPNIGDTITFQGMTFTWTGDKYDYVEPKLGAPLSVKAGEFFVGSPIVTAVQQPKEQVHHEHCSCWSDTSIHPTYPCDCGVDGPLKKEKYAAYAKADAMKTLNVQQIPKGPSILGYDFASAEKKILAQTGMVTLEMKADDALAQLYKIAQLTEVEVLAKVKKLGMAPSFGTKLFKTKSPEFLESYYAYDQAPSGTVLKVKSDAKIHVFLSDGHEWHDDVSMHLGTYAMILGVPLNAFPLNMTEGWIWNYGAGKEFKLIDGVFTPGVFKHPSNGPKLDAISIGDDFNLMTNAEIWTKLNGFDHVNDNIALATAFVCRVKLFADKLSIPMSMMLADYLVHEIGIKTLRQAFIWLLVIRACVSGFKPGEDGTPKDVYMNAWYQAKQDNLCMIFNDKPTPCHCTGCRIKKAQAWNVALECIAAFKPKPFEPPKLWFDAYPFQEYPWAMFVEDAQALGMTITDNTAYELIKIHKIKNAAQAETLIKACLLDFPPKLLSGASIHIIKPHGKKSIPMYSDMEAGLIFGFPPLGPISGSFNHGKKNIVLLDSFAAISEGDDKSAEQMALILKSMDGLAAIKKIGVPQELYDWLVSAGIKVEVKMGQGFVFKSAAGVDLAIAGTKLELIQKGQLGQLHGSLKQTMQLTIKNGIKAAMIASGVKPPLGSTLEDLPMQPKPTGLAMFKSPMKVGHLLHNKHAIDSAVNAVAATALAQKAAGLLNLKGEPDLADLFKSPEFSEEGVAHKNIKYIDPVKFSDSYKKAKAMALDHLPEADAALEAPIVKQVTVVGLDKWPLADMADIFTAAPVNLRHAECMYQPVQGSGKTNRYYVVACSERYRVAVHYEPARLSIRVEGPNFEDTAGELQPVFKGVNPASGYCSMHFDVSDDMIAAKALGAVLMAMGQPWETPMPNLAILKGK